MFWHVWHRASLCPQIQKVVLATDDKRIAEAAELLDVPVVMTRADHHSGTDRVFEAATALGVEEHAVVVNIQGDEPVLEPRMLTELIQPVAENASVMVSTLARVIDGGLVQSPDVVKVVCAANGNALYFSRAVVPYVCDDEPEARFLGHVGLYAFRYDALRRFTQLAPSALERTEKLEQLRLLENNIPIRVVQTTFRTHGVDRPEDIDVILNMIRENEG